MTAEEFTAFRTAHPGIEAVQLYITDPSGVPRGKLAALHELERLYTAGRPVAGGRDPFADPLQIVADRRHARASRRPRHSISIDRPTRPRGLIRPTSSSHDTLQPSSVRFRGSSRARYTSHCTTPACTR